MRIEFSLLAELSIQPELNNALLPRHLTESGNVASGSVDSNVERTQSENNAALGHGTANNASSSQSEMA